MPFFENCTLLSAVDTVGLDAQGAEYYLLAVKATYRWDDVGRCHLAEEIQPALATDTLVDDDEAQSVAIESDLAPEKTRVDVVLAGKIQLPTPVEQIDARIEIGDRLAKTVRLFGDRYWVASGPTVLSMTPPRAFSEMPIAWERSFGGTDPDDAGRYEARNPVGAGFAKNPKHLEKSRAPNFEDPDHPIRSWKDRPAPTGFGPLGREWDERHSLAGTLDDRWRAEQCPLPPADLDPAFHCCAPQDQRLDDYRPGEVVRLTHLTARGTESFTLPDFGVEILRQLHHSFRTEREALRPDTIIIEPAERRFSLVARYRTFPAPSLDHLGKILIGPSAARARAQQRRKPYADWRSGELRHP